MDAFGAPRLGELLVAQGTITPEQLQSALRAQVMWGGRLGTNLVDLALVTLDTLAQALARQHGIPAALEHHFERADPAIQKKLSAALANRLGCVPLLRLHRPPHQIAVAALDPIGAWDLQSVAHELGVEPGQLALAIAPELRIRYQLERVYKIPRDTRFLRVPGRTIPPSFEIDVDVDDAPPKPPPPPRRGPDLQRASAVAARLVAASGRVSQNDIPIDVELEPDDGIDLDFDGETMRRPPSQPLPRTSTPAGGVQPLPRSTTPAGGVRPPSQPLPRSTTPAGGVRPPSQPLPRTSTPADGVRPPSQPLSRSTTPAGGVRPPSQPLPRTSTPAGGVRPPLPSTPAGSERRRYVRTLADALVPEPGAPQVSRVSVTFVARPVDAPDTSLAGTLREIQTANERDRVAELAIDALARTPGYDAGVLLVIRGDVAIGWRGFSHTDSPRLDIAIPIDRPGIVPRTLERGTTQQSPLAELGWIDRLLAEALAGASAEALAIIPIRVAGTILCLVALATRANASAATAEAIANATGVALGRLIRNASR